MSKQRTVLEAEAKSAKRPLTVQNVLFALRRWWLLAAPLGLVLGVAAAAPVYYLFEPEYEASALLRIQDQAPAIVFNTRAEATTRFITTQVEIIRSDKVLAPVLAIPAIASLPEFRDAEDKLSAMRKKLKVASVGGSELYAISFTASSPEAAKSVSNAIMEQYLQVHAENADEQLSEVLTLLDRAREERQSEVDVLRKKVEMLAKQANVINPLAAAPKKQDETDSRPLAELENQLIAATVEEVMVGVELDAFKQLAVGKVLEVSSAAVELAIEQNPEVQRLKQSAADRRGKMEGIRATSTLKTKDPYYLTESKALEREETQLAQLRAELRGPIESELKENRLRERDGRIEQMEIKLAGLKVLKATLEQKITAEKGERDTLTGDTLQLEFAKEDLARAESIHSLIAERQAKLTTEQSAPEQVSRWQEAALPVRPVQELPYKQLALAAMFGFCIPFGLAVAWEHFHQRVADAAQLSANSNLLVVGEIASLPDSLEDVRNSRSRKVQDSLRLFEESIDNLRTCLVLSESLKDFHVLAVTSAVSNEGKTSVATQLAISLARATGKSTLLIDGDLRKPDVHNVFDLELSPGLAEVLDGSATMDEAISSSGHENVDVLSAGKRRKNPHELFGNGELTGIISQARQAYHFVVIDTPPVLSASESLVLSKLADIALICVRRAHSRIDQVRTVHDRLARAGAHTAGATLIGVPVRDYAYRYGSYGYNQG
jgi:capsular exopolysaccharide synthesis family protein